MVKRLAPAALFFTITAFGQTQVDLNKQVRNSLPYSQGGTNATAQIDARRNVGTPLLVATDFLGADIGAKVNSAFASFGAGKCGTVVIPAGAYNFSTQIFVPTGCFLEGAGRAFQPGAGDVGAQSNTTLNYIGPPATSAIVIAKSDFTRSDFSGVSNLTITSGASACPSNGMLDWNLDNSTWQCLAFGTSLAVTAATNAAPIAITTTSAHGYSSGDIVYISNVFGNYAANGRWAVTVTGATTFTLNGSAGNGAFTAGGTAEKLTYSAAVPHLAAIQLSSSNPTVNSGGTFNFVRNVFVSSNALAVGLHFGVYWNGAEYGRMEDVYVVGTDDGFVFTNAAQPVLATALRARINRSSGFHYTSGLIHCENCLAESNQWFGGPARPANPDRYGRGIAAGQLYIGDTHYGSGFFASKGLYVENNDIDLWGFPSNYTGGNSIDVYMLGSPNSLAPIRGPWGGNPNDARIVGCTGGPVSSDHFWVAGKVTLSTNCTPSPVPGMVPKTATNFYALTVVRTAEFPYVEKVYGLLNNASFTPFPVYSAPIGDGGQNAANFNWTYKSSSSPGNGIILTPVQDASAAAGNVSGTPLTWQSSFWDGAAAVAKNFDSYGFVGSDNVSSLVIEQRGKTRNFEFRENGEFRLNHNNTGQTPKLVMKWDNSGGQPADDNSFPEIQGFYRSDAGSADPSVAGFKISSSSAFGAPGTGNLWIFGANNLLQAHPTRATHLMIKPTANQGSINQQEWYDTTGSLASYVSPAGAIAVKPVGAQPACDSTTRFLYWSTAGGAGVKDKVEVCAKDAADAYAWRTIF